MSYSVLNALPKSVDFRSQLAWAREPPQPEAQLRRLADLTRFRLDFIETIQLARALQSGLAGGPHDWPAARIAVLGSSTIDHLLPAICVAGLRHGIRIDLYRDEYAQYRQCLLEPSPGLKHFAPTAVLLSITARELMGEVSVMASVKDADDSVDHFLSELRSLWRRAKETLGASILQQTFIDVSEPLFGNFDRLVPGAPGRVIARLNERLSEAAVEERVSVVDVAKACERDGRDAWFDVARWLQAKQEIAPAAAPAYGELVARVVAAQLGRSRKCLVLDLDNTLWGGIVGDDGLGGIVLGEGNPVGEAHLALQRYARQLSSRGVILAVCSKNDPGLAESAVQNHPEMLLRRGDFAAFAANWGDKAENLKAIAEQLNLGLDSLVLVDDNPVERARIRQALPEVAIPELPDDVAGYVRCIADAGYFEAVSFTAEDLGRSAQYAANAAREDLRGTAASLAEFLAGLQMTMLYGSLTEADMLRVHQLINKTNQFNLTTRRYTREEIEKAATDADSLTLKFRLLDRFGDNGLVSAMILRRNSLDAEEFAIDIWVMSCRVFGRRLEYAAMNVAAEAARARGARRIVARYIPTTRNAVVRDLYANLGFRPLDPASTGDGPTDWELGLANHVPRETPIRPQREEP
ncbi:MAG: HAD-IIIC family phosphatase [Steroidobacteraceae bacterium]